MPSLADSLRKTRQIFQDHALDNADLDARLLVEWATNTTRKDLLLNPDMSVPEDAQQRLQSAIKKRLDNMPVYRIIGVREFYGIPFLLSPETLEPRSDTETLVDLILPVLENMVAKNGQASFLDMGTGTGAIAISALVNVKQTHATAVDISSGALETAQRNAENAGVASRFHACLSNWFERVEGRFDLIVSNPPYIPDDEVPLLAKEVKDYDPYRALAGGKDGLYFYDKLAKEAMHFLNPLGMIAVEIGQGQENDVIGLFEKAGFHCMELRKDLSAITRALLFSR